MFGQPVKQIWDIERGAFHVKRERDGYKLTMRLKIAGRRVEHELALTEPDALCLVKKLGEPSRAEQEGRL